MECDYSLCIYNMDFVCCLKSVSMDALGMCAECILPTIPDAELHRYKQETLNALDEAYPDE